MMSTIVPSRAADRLLARPVPGCGRIFKSDALLRGIALDQIDRKAGAPPFTLSQNRPNTQASCSACHRAGLIPAASFCGRLPRAWGGGGGLGGLGGGGFGGFADRRRHES